MRKLALWGHGIDAYRGMFNLSDEELNSKILEFGCGLSAFNIQQNQSNHAVVSCDPLFVLDKDTLWSKAVMIFADMSGEMKKEQAVFDLRAVGGIDKLLISRQAGMSAFIADFVQGKTEGRYLGVTDLQLPFADFTFDYALCAHYLFAELDDQNLEFHLTLIRELARVAKEVRIFPLIDREGKTSELLGPILLGLQQDNYGAEVKEVNFHLYQSSNAMLRVWAQQCPVR